jgi:hypothetical protein
MPFLLQKKDSKTSLGDILVTRRLCSVHCPRHVIIDWPMSLRSRSHGRYTTRVVLNGKAQTVTRRERPQLVFDAATGVIPVALYNGVCVGDVCFNVVMPFNNRTEQKVLAVW